VPGDPHHIDQNRMAAFMQQFIADLGATIAAGGVVLGDRLGLYRALATGRMRPQELARRTGTAPRYVEEWLRAQAAGGYVEYDATTGEYHLPPEQARVLADPDAEVYAPAAFQLALGALRAEPLITRAFQTGEGVAWSEQDADVFAGCERFAHASYRAKLLTSWLPALDGVVGKLCRGARVADVGCGYGSATIMMAKAFPASEFVGWDSHAPAVDAARRGCDASLASRARFEVGGANDLDGGPYDVVTTFDVLHDMGDPFGAARRIRDQLAPDGTWMIVEPAAGSSVTANLNPVGRIYYSFSTFVCVPNALAQEGGYSLGAQAGPAPVRRLVQAAGFRGFRRVAQDEMRAVYEARP
jgi:SAM-dependent methyltransferase